MTNHTVVRREENNTLYTRPCWIRIVLELNYIYIYIYRQPYIKRLKRELSGLLWITSIVRKLYAIVEKAEGRDTFSRFLIDLSRLCYQPSPVNSHS